MTDTGVIPQHKRWYRANKEWHNERVNRQHKARRTTVRGRAANLLSAAKQRAGWRGEPFTLTLEHVVQGLERGVCPRTGFWFDLSGVKGVGRGKGHQNPFAPSLDRIDNTKPYTDDNVQVVCWQYNAMKQVLTQEQLVIFCKAIVERA